VAGGNSANTHYSALRQDQSREVTQLQVAWTFDAKTPLRSEIECKYGSWWTGLVCHNRQGERDMPLERRVGPVALAFDPTTIRNLGLHRGQGPEFARAA